MGAGVIDGLDIEHGGGGHLDPFAVQKGLTEEDAATSWDQQRTSEGPLSSCRKERRHAKLDRNCRPDAEESPHKPIYTVGRSSPDWD